MGGSHRTRQADGPNPEAEFSTDAVTAFLENVHCAAPVSGHTHNFYRYPARFSPQFARAAINLFTSAGDTVFDCFSGGGTTAVEALLTGRRFVGCDLNSLATFVAKVKTTPLSDKDIEAITVWGEELPNRINLHRPNVRHEDWEAYQQNVPWWLRKLLESALDETQRLGVARRVRFARCSLLRTAQWALDCRKEIPSAREFLVLHGRFLRAMLSGVKAFSDDVRMAGERLGRARLLARSAIGIERDRRLPRDWMPPRLVLTSPPYLGVHVLYHRWQVRGRRETPAPYWVAGCQDGHGGSYYTFADRRNLHLEPYLDQLRECFTSVARLLDSKSLVVQLVAFSDPAKQLTPYLRALDDAGLEEAQLAGAAKALTRVWRKVPNRKWYANLRPGINASNELLLIHKLRDSQKEG